MGICHRDLKPENVFLGDAEDDTDIYLGDFGLSKFVSPQQLMDEACGTVCYAAPELLRREGYDKTVDAWSVGVLLYLMLIGGLPFYHHEPDENKRDQIIGNMILKEEVSFAYSGWNQISDEAIDLTKKLLIKDPKKRLNVAQALDHPWFDSIRAMMRRLSSPSVFKVRPILSPMATDRDFSNAFSSMTVSPKELFEKEVQELDYTTDFVENWSP